MEQEDGKPDLLLTPLKKSEPYIPKSIVVGGSYEVLIKNVYDPSKFWIVLKFQELFIFMGYLKEFYGTVTNRKVIPRCELKKDLLCIVNRNNMYYRSVVLPVLLPDVNKIRVFVIDFGLIINVNVEEVFYIFQKHCSVPRFAIRACLANISPVDQSHTWSHSDLLAFCEVIGGKRIFAEVCQMDKKRNVLFVDIRLIRGDTLESINELLVKMERAIYNNKYCASKVEALEDGRVPCSLWESNLLKSSVPLDLLLQNYYQYQDLANGINY